MSPQLIPWLFCSALCILPIAVGTAVFFAWCQFTNRIPWRDVTTFTDGDGRKTIRTEWSMLTREEKRSLEKEEEK